MYMGPVHWARLGATLLSLCGSVFTLHRLLPEKPWTRPHVRACLVVLIAIGDLLFSLSQISTMPYQLFPHLIGTDNDGCRITSASPQVIKSHLAPDPLLWLIRSVRCRDWIIHLDHHLLPISLSGHLAFLSALSQESDLPPRILLLGGDTCGRRLHRSLRTDSRLVEAALHNPR